MDTQSIPRDERTANRVRDSELAPLTFTAVDGLAFAARKGKLDRKLAAFVPKDMGPLLELAHLSDDGALPPLDCLLHPSRTRMDGFLSALRSSLQYWLCPATKQLGFFRTTNHDSDLSHSYHFGIGAQRAAIAVGFPEQVAGQLAAAINEMVDNIYLHSTMSETGIAAFHARNGCFEFAVLDRGVGVLRSLQGASEYESLSDHGDALQLALTDGCSRFGPYSRHGHGFRPLFVGLSNLNGSLRFRSGDHALTIDGRNPQSIPWTKIAKPNVSGFLALVSCRTRPRL